MRTITWTVACRTDRNVDCNYTIQLNLAGGFGGRGPERRGGELKKLCFPCVSRVGGEAEGLGILSKFEALKFEALVTVRSTVSCKSYRESTVSCTTPD